MVLTRAGMHRNEGCAHAATCECFLLVFFPAGFLKFIVHNVEDLNLLLMHNRCVLLTECSPAPVMGEQPLLQAEQRSARCAAHT